MKKKSNKQSLTLEDRFDILFKHLVPSQGKSGTLQGEVIRATAKIAYRWNNDGDKFYLGYGKQTCGNAISFLLECPDLDITTEDGTTIQFRKNVNKLFVQVKSGEIKYQTFIDELISEAFHYVTESNPEGWFVVPGYPYPPNVIKTELDMLEWPNQFY
jgi:hypothetical protein